MGFSRSKATLNDIYEATQRLGLRTDVFHYIISLKSKERKNQEVHTINQDVLETASSEASPSIKEQSSPSIIRKEKQRIREEINETPSQLERGIEITEPSYEDIAQVIKAKYNQKSLKVPVTLLSVSIITFILSLLFFCHRTDSAGFIGCMVNLFSF